MTLMPCLAVLVMAITAATAAETPPPVTLYLQLVRGTSDNQPPAKDSKAIGPKLAGQFQKYSAWKHYWEVARQEVKLHPGQKTKVKLSPEREVEIDLSVPGSRSVTAYDKGKAVSRATDRLNTELTIIGGERDAKTAWFIAVRRDKPVTE